MRSPLSETEVDPLLSWMHFRLFSLRSGRYDFFDLLDINYAFHQQFPKAGFVSIQKVNNGPDGQEGPGCRQLRQGTEGASSKTRSPLSSRQHPQKCQKQALRGRMKQCSPKVAQRSPTSPENNLGGRAMQVRVPWIQAGLCTKDFRRKCTEAGVAAKVAVPSNAVWRGEARTYLHQTWTEESLDCGSHLDRVAGFKGPRSSC
ncbi:hypothetical protein NDU88_004977 [Pleurodeles waltl]|uniref:Uncharacterized protein n=1 Tax=Pleurodeles waltl TaxID=8319 RepID=A0AAV7KZB0_PLEWA|nr:hypothetical protein NDU88_004977 [Pleurodeles waltl]